MYESFFGFHEKPFSATPDPKYFYPSAKHKEALAHLKYGIRERMGFIVLTGEVGCGKTLLIRSLLAQLPDNVRRALILNPKLSADELLQAIMEDFGLPVQPTDTRKALLDRFNRFLIQEHAARRTVVVIVDEAQNLDPEALEALRLLSNIETETVKLLQIILVGQPELSGVLDQPKVRQLRQRVTVRYHLKPLDLRETSEYIEHRLRVAGSDGSVQFSRGAINRIYAYSGGVPRTIGIVCDHALLIAFTTEKKKITEAMVDEVIASREPVLSGGTGEMLPFAVGPAPRKRSRWVVPAAVLSGVLVGGALVLAGVWLFNGRWAVPKWLLPATGNLWVLPEHSTERGDNEAAQRMKVVVAASPPAREATRTVSQPDEPVQDVPTPPATETMTPAPTPSPQPLVAVAEPTPSPLPPVQPTVPPLPQATETAREAPLATPFVPSVEMPRARIYQVPSGQALTEMVPGSAGARYSVQVACFRSPEQAKVCARELVQLLAQPVYIVEDRTEFLGDWHRVLVGAAQERADAERLVQQVREMRHYRDAYLLLNTWVSAKDVRTLE